MTSSLTSSMVSFLCDLIRIRSVCGINGERVVAERICLECQSLKLRYDLVSAPNQEDRPNVIVTAGMSHCFLFHKQNLSFRKWSFEIFICRSYGYGKY
jgi:hypothetical protein